MSALLSYEILADGIRFSCVVSKEQLHFDQWAGAQPLLANGKPARTGTLSLLLENECAEECDNGFRVQVPHKIIATLEGFELQGLGLPLPAELRLVITTEGLLTSPRFTVSYGFTYRDSLPATGIHRIGTYLKHGSREFTLVDPLYSVVELIDEYLLQPINDIDERFIWWAKVKELLPQDAEVSPFLRNINVMKAEYFTVDCDLYDDLEITPRLITASQSNDANGGPENGQNEPADLLPPGIQEEFAETFLRHKRSKVRYGLPGNWYVTIAPSLRKALEIVHALQKEPLEIKKSFLHNPRGFLKDRLSGIVSEEVLEFIFVETRQFLSKRIRYLGEWKPKAGVYVKGGDSAWLPDEISISFDGKIYSIKPKDIPAVLSEMEKAVKEQREWVVYEGQKLPASKDSCETLRIIENEFLKKQEQETDRPSEPKAKPVLPDRPIIKDNIETEEYIAEPGQERPYVAVQPGLRPGVRLHSHQLQGLQWFQEHWKAESPGVLLADDMGLGKTLQTLAFMDWVRQQMKNGCAEKRPFLVVAPTALLANWEEEEEKHLQPGLGFLIKAHGSKARHEIFRKPRRAREIFSQADWVLTTYETVRDKIDYFIRVHWGIVAFDEAQKIKNPACLLTDMAKSLKADFTAALTGTPVENSLIDLWCIVDTVHPGKLGSLSEFKKRFIPAGVPEENLLEELKNELLKTTPQPLMLRRSKDKNWRERPPKTDIVKKRHMPSIQAEAYQNVVKEAQLIRSRGRGEMLKIIQNLRKVSLHPIILRNGLDDQSYIDASARLQATFDILDDIAEKGDKALIFIEFLQIQGVLSEIIQRRYGCGRISIINGQVSGKKRQQRVNEFQKSEKGFGVIILSPKAGGVGITLTAACHVIHLSRWWNPAVEDQCSDRVYRIGQKQCVSIYYPIAVHPDYDEKHSFDIKLHELLERKRALSRRLLAPPGGSDSDIEHLFNTSVPSSN